MFLVDFFADSPAPASEWRVLNDFGQRLVDMVGAEAALACQQCHEQQVGMNGKWWLGRGKNN